MGLRNGAKKKPRCRNRGPLTIACHMKKSSMLIFALFLAALIFMPQRFLLPPIACHKNRFWNKSKSGRDSFRVNLGKIS